VIKFCIATVLVLFAVPVKAGTEFEGQWPELSRSSQDTFNGLKCFAWLGSRNGTCTPISARRAHCDIRLFDGVFPYEVQGGGSGDRWAGYITVGGQAIGAMVYNTRFTPYRAPDRSLVVQRFTYSMVDGTQSSCEVRQYSKAFWAFLDMN
jgi:hypothetical protein